MIVGIDPGSKKMGVALLGPERPRVFVLSPSGKTARIRASFAALLLSDALEEEVSSPLLAAVEWQEFRPGRERNPQAVLEVQAYSGLAIAVVALLCPTAEFLTCTPSEWKGQRSKGEHTEALWQQFLAEGGDPSTRKVLGAGLPDAMDAFGIAVWARNRAGLKACVEQWKS